MWFLGLLFGLLLGGTYGGFSGALGGALLGAIAGVLLKSVIAQRSPPPRSLDVRIHSLENRIDELNRAIGDLQARLRRLEPAQPDSTNLAVTETAAAIPSVELEISAGGSLHTAEVTTHDAPVAIAEAIASPNTPVASTPSPVGVGQITAAGNTYLTRLFGGNILAKIGVVLLFFGVASGLKLAAQYGFLPIPLRLLLGAAAAMTMTPSALCLSNWPRLRADVSGAVSSRYTSA